MVAPIDTRSVRLTGPPVSIAEGVAPPVEFGTRGLLLVAGGASDDDRVIVFANRNGRRDTLPHAAGPYWNFDVSPDIRRIAIAVGASFNMDLRLLDVATPASRAIPQGY